MYVYKRYVRATIDQAIQKDEQDELDLIKTKGDLKSRYGMIADQINKQEDLGRSLSEKIAQWRSSCSANEKEQASRMAAVRDHMLNRLHEQEKYIETHTLQAYVKPQALEHAEKELKTYFAHQAPGKKYIHDIVTYLDKEAS